MSMKTVRMVVDPKHMMSDFEAMLQFVGLLYEALGLSEAVVRADLADADETELKMIIASLA